MGEVANGDGGNSDGEDFGLSAFSVIKEQPSNGGSGGPGDGGFGGEGEIGRSIAGHDGGKEDASEFQLVNSRNIEVLKF